MSSATAAPAVPGQRYKFVVRSAEEAATAIREKLGETAQVISVRQVEGQGLARFLQAPRLEVIAEIPAPAEPKPALTRPLPQTESPEVERPREEQRMPNRLWTVLARAGLPKEFVARLSDRPEWKVLPDLPLHAGLARAASLLRDAVPTRSHALGKRVAFFGTPGAGATTALCKQLAYDVFFHRRPTCVMKLDTEEPNSTEGLAMFCEALGVPLLRSAAEVLDVSAETTVYFDVPGAPVRTAARDRLRQTFSDLAIPSRVLVVNAAYERELIQHAYTQAEALGGTHVVFTHLDELTFFGKLWEFALAEGLAPLFASTGQNVAGDCDRNIIDLLVRRTLSAAQG